MRSSGKGKNGIAAFVTERHSVGKRTFARGPPHVHTQRLIDPGSHSVERLVSKGLDHSEQLGLGPFARQLRYKAGDSGHSKSVQIGRTRGRLAFAFRGEHSRVKTGAGGGI